MSGRDGAVGIATKLQTGRCSNPGRGEIIRTPQTRPEAHLASCTMGNEVLSRRYSDRGVVLTTHHPVLKLRMSGATPLLHIPAEPSWIVIRGMGSPHT